MGGAVRFDPPLRPAVLLRRYKRFLADVRCPGLMITGKLDRIIPWEQTKRIADEAPNTRFVLYEEGNHVCNNIPFKYRPLVADWLRKELADVG